MEATGAEAEIRSTHNERLCKGLSAAGIVGCGGRRPRLIKAAALIAIPRDFILPIYKQLEAIDRQECFSL